MQRELKFRAWDNLKKEWLMGYQYGNRGFSLIGELMACSEWQAVLCDMVRGDFGEHGEHLIVQQFTGLKDKNGKEVYEGDIILGFMSSDGFKHVAPVEWTGFGWSAVSRQGNNMIIWLESDFEVIGNINENPELLV